MREWKLLIIALSLALALVLSAGRDGGGHDSAGISEANSWDSIQ